MGKLKRIFSLVGLIGLLSLGSCSTKSHTDLERTREEARRALDSEKFIEDKHGHVDDKSQIFTPYKINRILPETEEELNFDYILRNFRFAEDRDKDTEFMYNLFDEISSIDKRLNDNDLWRLLEVENLHVSSNLRNIYFGLSLSERCELFLGRMKHASSARNPLYNLENERQGLNTDDERYFKREFLWGISLVFR